MMNKGDVFTKDNDQLRTDLSYEDKYKVIIEVLKNEVDNLMLNRNLSFDNIKEIVLNRAEKYIEKGGIVGKGFDIISTVERYIKDKKIVENQFQLRYRLSNLTGVSSNSINKFVNDLTSIEPK